MSNRVKVMLSLANKGEILHKSAVSTAGVCVANVNENSGILSKYSLITEEQNSPVSSKSISTNDEIFPATLNDDNPNALPKSHLTATKQKSSNLVLADDKYLDPSLIGNVDNILPDESSLAIKENEQLSSNMPIVTEDGVYLATLIGNSHDDLPSIFKATNNNEPSESASVVLISSEDGMYYNDDDLPLSHFISKELISIPVLLEDPMSEDNLNETSADDLQVFKDLSNIVPNDRELQQCNNKKYEFLKLDKSCQIISNEVIQDVDREVNDIFIENIPPSTSSLNIISIIDSHGVPSGENAVNDIDEVMSPNQPIESCAGNNTRKNLDDKGYTKAGNPRKRRRIDPKTKIEEKNMMREKYIEKHGVLPACDVKGCIKDCLKQINENQRTAINKNFWSLTNRERKAFMLNTCTRQDPKRRTTESNTKQNTFKYYLKDEADEVVQVCKTFFLTTLGYKKSNDRVLYDTLSKTQRNKFNPPKNRHCDSAKKRIDYSLIDEHIETFHPSISHYRRAHAPNRRYLPSDISISTMFEDFKSKNANSQVSYESYRLRVRAKNISFAVLGHEECEECEEFKLHKHDEENTCQICSNYKKHKNLVIESREFYQTQSGTNFEKGNICVSADLQKIIMLPRVDSFKKVIFIKRLIAYNESFVPLGSKSQLKPYAVLWHEGVSGRDKEDIASCFYSFFKKHRDATQITIWLDNCSSQNKNWCLLTFLVRLINSDEISATDIFLNYFEPGHSFMSSDSFHHQVELSLKKQGKTYDFDDFVDAVQQAQKGKVEVKKMDFQDFYQWKDFKSEVALKKYASRPHLSDMVQIKASRGNYALHYKTSYIGDFIKLDFLCKKAAKKTGVLSADVASRTKPRGFPKSKKEELLKNLGGILPESRKTFWKNLPECED